MTDYSRSNPVLPTISPFTLICSFEVPTTELDPDFIPSVSVCIGEYQTLEQAKQARQAIQHPALISAWCHQSFVDAVSEVSGGVQ